MRIHLALVPPTLTNPLPDGPDCCGEHRPQEVENPTAGLLQAGMRAFRSLVRLYWLFFAAVGACVAAPSPAPSDGSAPGKRARALASLAPNLNPEVLERALNAMACAIRGGLAPSDRLAIIDFSLPSSRPRLWVFDLKQKRLVLEDLVAHGRNSGDHFARTFSNVVGSHQSSIGLFRTQESYTGRHGYSLRMDGLEPGVNDRARERAIVIHGADYVDSSWIARRGRIGRSHGCPAVRKAVVRTVVDALKGGQFLFAHYPEPAWLSRSPYLNCEPGRIARIIAPLRARGG